MTAIRAEEEGKKTTGKRSYEFEPYIVGLSRDALGRPPLESNPNPLSNIDLPAGLRNVIKEHAETQARSGILALGRPQATPETGTLEEAVADWKVRRDSREEWLDAHKDSPAVREAIDEALAKYAKMKAPKRGKLTAEEWAGAVEGYRERVESGRKMREKYQ
jgi:hypothetical protein